MAFSDCIDGALKAGKINEQQRDQAAKYADVMGEEKATEQLRTQILGKKAQLARAYAAKQNMDAAIAKEGSRPVRALGKQLELSRQRTEVIKNHFARTMKDFITKFTRGNFGILRNAADADKFGRAVYEDMALKGDTQPFSKMAQAYKEMQAQIRNMAQNAGGVAMREMEKYGLPTQHDGVAFDKAGFNKWFKDVSDPSSPMRWDWKNMTDFKDRSFSTYTPEEIRDWAKAMYDHVTTDDWTRASKGTANLAEQFARRRYVQFADYDGWKAYGQEYGSNHGDAISAVEGHLSSSARDIAMMEQFGPNPGATIMYGREAAMKAAASLRAENEGATTKSPVNYAKRDLKKFDGVYDGYMGQGSPVTAGAAAYGVGRNIIYAGQVLGKALLAQATNDPIFRVPNLKMVYGLPASQMIETAAHYIGNVKGDEGRQLALRLGVSAEGMLDNMHSSAKIMRDHPIYGASQMLPDVVGRVFGVHAHMQALPASFAEGLLSWFAKTKDMPWAQLSAEHPEWTQALTREGINEKDWDDFRSTPVFKNKGINYLVPDDVMGRKDLDPARANELGQKWGMMVNKVSREAVPAFSLDSKYNLLGGVNPNTFMGFIVRDATIALHFTASTLKMWTSGFQLRQGVASKVGYTAASAVSLMMATALQQQMKAVVTGRDPYNMNPEKPEGQEFWKTVAERSGALGPYWDLLNPMHEGGVVNTAVSAAKIAAQGAGHMMGLTDKDPNAGAKMLKIGRNLVPGANGWYTQLLVQNGIIDSLQREIDPQAYASWDKTQNFYQKNYGQGTYWERGQSAPSRAPDFSKLF